MDSFYEHPDESFYYCQVARELGGLSVGTIQRELDLLSQLGLLERSTVGKQVFYRANRSHPVFPELRALVAKTIGTVPMLRAALAPLADSISVAFIYSSMARREESDIDLLIVGKATLEDVLGKLGSVESSLRPTVNPTVYSPSELKARACK